MKLVYNAEPIEKGGRPVGRTTQGVEAVQSWLSPSQAGRVLGTSGQWITHLARSGELRGVKTALGWLVDPEDVEDLAKKSSGNGQKAPV